MARNWTIYYGSQQGRHYALATNSYNIDEVRMSIDDGLDQNCCVHEANVTPPGQMLLA